jgi:hypothetical protein
VLGNFTVPTRPLYIVYPPGLQSLHRLRLFIEYIDDWFKKYPIDDDTALHIVPRPDAASGAT